MIKLSEWRFRMIIPKEYTMETLTNLLSLNDFNTYYKEADQVRKENVGDEIQIRALLEFSNYCKRQCSYCGLNCFNKETHRFRMTPEEIIESANSAHEVGYKTIVLQSGEDSFFTAKILGEIVKEIKKTGIKITLSCGEFSYDDYAYLRECGADRYLLKQETADEEIYRMIHPDSTLEQRVACLKNLKKLGFETGSGFMIGLPNQTNETIAKDLLLLKEIGCHMAGIGPFIPHPNTKLKDIPSGNTELTKKAVALARLILPKANLPATTSLGVIDKSQKRSVFDCGANVVMQKITPNNLKRFYEIYPSSLLDFTIEQGRKNIENEIIEMGRIPV